MLNIHIIDYGSTTKEVDWWAMNDYICSVYGYKMEREERYYIIKKSDLEGAISKGRLISSDRDRLKEILESIQIQRYCSGKEPLKAVVVESDWPEYERVWKMIEARVNMENQHQVIKLNEGVIRLATLIAQACVQDAHEEGYDIEAGMFGPNLSKILVDANEWRKKAELFDNLQYCEGCGGVKGNHHRECQHPNSFKG